MENGTQIKKIRKQLKATQHDLANINFSRNLISSIEQNQTHLTIPKGLMIFEKLHEISLEKQIMVDLELDDLLGGLMRYNHLKSAYQLCKKIFTATVQKLNLDDLTAEIEKHMLYDIGLHKHFIFYYTARYYKNTDPERSLNYFFLALDSIKWYAPQQQALFYINTLREATPIAVKANAFESLSVAQSFGVKLMEDFQEDFNVNQYYNLAFFSFNAKKYKDTILNINIYLRAQHITPVDIIDAKMLQAEAFILLGEVDKGILLFEESLLMVNKSIVFDQHARVLSKLIYYISQLDLQTHINFLDYYSKSLLELIPKVSSKVDTSDLYFSLAICETYCGHYHKGFDYFNRIPIKTVLMLKEGYFIYKKMDKLDAFHEMIASYDSELECCDQLSVLKMKLKIL